MCVTMKAIIPAAGLGSRLLPITDKIPKTLFEINKKPILAYILDALIENDVTDIILILGHKSEQILAFCKKNYPGLNITFIKNEDYSKSNIDYSLYLANNYLNDDIIVVMSDVIIESEIITNLISRGGSCDIIDFKEKYNTPQVVIENNFVKKIGGNLNHKITNGCHIGVYSICAADVLIFKSELVNLIENKKNFRVTQSAVLDDLINNKKLLFKALDVGSLKYCEVDNIKDLKQAEKIFKDVKK